jgi:hypothetical protein
MAAAASALMIAVTPAASQETSAPAETMAPAVEAIPAQAAPVPAPAPAAPQPTLGSAAVGAPPAGQGQVVFFRPGSMMGMALGCTVRESGVELARLGSGKYYAVNFAPGSHQFTVESEAKDVLNMEIEPDETYYVQCKIGMGIMAGRPNISPSDKANWDKRAAKLKPWVPKGDK